MSELPNGLASAPGPEVLPGPPDTPVAYTDFRRDGSAESVATWPRGVSVTAARLEGYGRVELVELDGRATDGRAFLAAVGRWDRVADHDHVAPVVGSGKRPRPWVATAGDATLADRADPALESILWTGVCLADALAYAHDEGVVHGSLRPERVRLHPAPDWPYPRLDGFGLARLLREATDGTARAAPEQVTPEPYHGTGTATDVYGLALTLYEALTGDLPYVTDGDPRAAVLGTAPVPPSTVDPALPDAVDDLLLPALAKDPADRPEVGAFRDDLVSLLAAETPGSAGGRGSGVADPTVDSSFPFLDGDRADWRTACPSCGRSVTNTLAAFRAHWRDAERCDGPPERPPVRAEHSREEWTRVVESVESASPASAPGGSADADHPLWGALAEERVVEVGGVAVASADGTYPWLSYPRRGWRVPCPACGSTVFNDESAMKAHWSDAPGCPGPPDDFRTA